MSIRNHSIISTCIVIVTIGLLLIPSVSAGSSPVASSTRKLIVTPWVTPSTPTTYYQPASSEKWFIFASGGVSLVPPPPTLEELHGYNLSSTACGVNGCGGGPIDSLAGQGISKFYTYPNAETSTACGRCGNSFIKPYQNPW